jgi:hypothetical protein
MTPEQLIEIGKKLAKPCVHLTETGDQAIGFWGGDGVVPAPSGNFKHWFSFSTNALPQGLF